MLSLILRVDQSMNPLTHKQIKLVTNLDIIFWPICKDCRDIPSIVNRDEHASWSLEQQTETSNNQLIQL